MVEPIRVHIEVFGDTQIDRTLLRFGSRAMNAIPLWNSLYQDFLNIEQVQFLTEGSHGSGGWPQLAESTLLEKERRHQPTWILRATEVLFKSLTQRGALGNIRDIGPGWMRFGSDIPYGIYHQTGTVNMPMRKPLEFTELERVAVVKKVQRFIIYGEVVGLV